MFLVYVHGPKYCLFDDFLYYQNLAYESESIWGGR